MPQQVAANARRAASHGKSAYAAPRLPRKGAECRPADTMAIDAQLAMAASREILRDMP